MTDSGPSRKMSNAKLVILGRENCGKTALCVRFITKRFIGEYDHKKEVTYRCRKTVDKEPIDLEILDTANKGHHEDIGLRKNIRTLPTSMLVSGQQGLGKIRTSACTPEESVGSAATSLETSIKWGNGFLIMYSVTDRSSFESVSRLKRLIDHVKQTLGIPTVIVANKCDMENGRAVRTEEGKALASDLRCSFFELSVAESSLAVEAAVEKLVQEVRLDYHCHLLAMDRRSRMLQMRHALSRKLTRSKTMQW